MSTVTFCATCHGRNVQLSDDNATATRNEGFNHGITFSSQPVAVGEKVSVEIRDVVVAWSGAIRYGFTNHEPGTINSENLPAYAMPNLSSLLGYWAKALKESFNVVGNILSFYITKDGEVYSFVNNVGISRDVVKSEDIDVKRPMWIVFDVYGKTKSIQLHKDHDATPAEILSRGPEAMQAFKQAANNGTRPIFRTRLMLVGQDRVGKTSLKRSLTGQSHNPEEGSTDGIDTTDACEIYIENATGWRLAQDSNQDKAPATVDDSSSLQDTFTQALALNIAKVLWKKKRSQEVKGPGSSPAIEHDESTHSKEDSKDDVWITSATDTSSDEHTIEENMSEKDQLLDLAKSLDEVTFNLVTSQVEKLLQEAEGGNVEVLEERSMEEAAKRILLSIWDFAGQSVYYTTHQVFLSSRAVYVLVFNLCHDLDAPAQTQIRPRTDSSEYRESEFSNLDFMDFWMRSIHAHTAENRKHSLEGTTLSPPLFIVGTHRNSLSPDPEEQMKIVAEKFSRITRSLSGKPYLPHVLPTFYAVENNVADEQDEQVAKLRRHIEAVAAQEPYMGEHVPLKWLWFQKKMADFVSQGINYMSLDDVSECAASVGVTSEGGLQTMLQFYHDLGVIIYYGGPGAPDPTLRNTVILRPQWLVDIFRRVITVKDDDKWPLLSESRKKLNQDGVLEDQLLDQMWTDVLDQKETLLGLMEKFDLLCERIPPQQKLLSAVGTSPAPLERSYYVPSRLQDCPNPDDLKADTNASLAFYITFGGFLPDGLFHRILTRAVRWCQEQGGREPRLFHRQARFYVNEEHDALLEMAPARYARIKVTVLRVDIHDGDDPGRRPAKIKQSSKEACAKVRHFLDTTLADLRRICMKRVWYEFTAACPCSRRCLAHSREGCGDAPCLHFLRLDECLSKKIVMCESRRIRTNVFQKWFPSEKTTVPAPLPAKATTLATLREEDIPSWVKVSAKLLNSGAENSDWLSLAYRLGYKKAKIQKLTEDESNPALCILLDWFQSSGNTALSVEMLLAYLEQMKRDDVIDVIQKGQDVNKAPPTVFISYNWGVQEEVRALRDFLERSGYPCWMDIGQMGGGDVLYNKIYQGIHRAKVFLCCVTPQYIVSESCSREVSLADQLKKPIIPIIFKKVPWPPPGGLALIMSQLIYVDFDGVGGHGGSGVKADLEMKYQDVMTQMQRYTPPVQPENAVKKESSAAEIITTNNSGPRDNATPTTPSERSGVQRSPSGGGSNRTQSLGGVSLGAGRQPHQVAVTKCAICCIL